MHVLLVESALHCYVILCVYVLENTCSLDRMRFILLRCIICVYFRECMFLGRIRFILLRYIMCVCFRECMFFGWNPLYTVTLYYVCMF